MSKPLIGVILGAVLGAIDGLTAWFTPEVRDQLGGIVIGSTVKGIIAGIAIGFFAKKFHSLPLGILFGCSSARSRLSDRVDAGRLLLRDRPARDARRIDRRFRHAEVWEVARNGE